MANEARQTAEELGIDKSELANVFAYAAQKYASKKKKQPLNGIAREFFEVLYAEGHTTMREFEEHRRTMAGRDPATVRRRITTLERRGLPVQREKAIDDKGVDPIGYTRYFLTPTFKKALLEEAREWLAERSAGMASVDIDNAGSLEYKGPGDS